MPGLIRRSATGLAAVLVTLAIFVSVFTVPAPVAASATARSAVA